MSFVRWLGQISIGMKAVYSIAFTGLLLYELVKYRFNRKRRQP